MSNHTTRASEQNVGKSLETVLDLSSVEPFAEGGSRLCYVHPHDAARCIKIVKEGRIDELRRRAPWFKRLRGDASFDDNEREIAAFHQLAIRTGDERLWQHLPRLYGYVQTSVGKGLVTDLILNADGIAGNLEDYIKAHGVTLKLARAIDEFCLWLRQTQVLTKNLLPHNILVKEVGDSLQLYVIDGIGRTTAIDPNWFGSWMVHRYIESRLAKMQARIQWEASGRPGEWKVLEKKARRWR